MESPFFVPYLARIILSLASILVFQKLFKRFDVAMTLGIVLLALWTGHSASSMAHIAGERFFSLDMLFLALVIAGVIWLSTLMSQSGIMRDMVVCLKSRLSRRSILIALPAVVGLLPMPAGALFSAPLVEDADDVKILSPDQKTKINYWFRHIWEFWWPLYPGVLLAVDLTGLPIWQFILIMFPMFFFAIGGGYFFLLRSIPPGERSVRQKDDKAFLPLISPILTVIGVYCILLAAAPWVARINNYLPMFFGVLCGLGVLQLQRPASFSVWLKTIFSLKVAGLVAIIVLARIYGAFIEARLADGMLLMEKVRLELDSYGIPALLLIIVIPLISGLSTGITVGYIGASFPVVLSLAGATRGELYSTMILGYACGFIGMMLSPIHVCLIVTNEYFRTRVHNTLGGLLRPALAVFAAACLYSYLWYVFG